MKYKAFMIRLLLLLIILSVAAPTRRSLMSDSNKIKKPLFQEYQLMSTNHEAEVVGEKFDLEGGFFEGRMDFEEADYPGTGANPGHDPKPPGKV